MSDIEKPDSKRKESRWPAPNPDERPHERARRAINRIAYGVDTKRRIAPD